MLCSAAVAGLLPGSSSAGAEMTPRDIKLPDAVERTFKTTFPKGEIMKLEVGKENGVTVYDFEFKDGSIEKETDIAADGTMLEFTMVIGADAIPAGAMKTIREAAQGANLKRIERVEIICATKGGKIVKLPERVTHYEVEMAKGDLRAEIVVSPDGSIVEKARWGAGEEEGQEGSDDGD